MGSKQINQLRNNLRFLDGLVGTLLPSAEEMGSSGTGAPIKKANWLPRAIMAQRQLNRLLDLSFNKSTSYQAGKVGGMGKLNAGKMSGIKDLGFVKASTVKLTLAKESTLQAKAVANRLKATLTKKLKIKAMPKKSADITNANGNVGATLWSHELVSKLNNVQTETGHVGTVSPFDQQEGNNGYTYTDDLWQLRAASHSFTIIPDLSGLAKVDPLSPFKIDDGASSEEAVAQFDAEKFINTQELQIAARLASGLDGGSGDDNISLAQANNMMRELTNLLSLRIKTTPIYDTGQDDAGGPKKLVLTKLTELYAATLTETEVLLSALMAEAGYPDGLKA